MLETALYFEEITGPPPPPTNTETGSRNAKWVECFDTTDNRGQGLRAIKGISKNSMPGLVYYGLYYHNTDTKEAHPIAKHSTYVLGSDSTGYYDGAVILHQLATKLNHAPTHTQKNKRMPRHANCKIYWIEDIGQPVICLN